MNTYLAVCMKENCIIVDKANGLLHEKYELIISELYGLGLASSSKGRVTG